VKKQKADLMASCGKVDPYISNGDVILCEPWSLSGKNGMRAIQIISIWCYVIGCVQKWLCPPIGVLI